MISMFASHAVGRKFEAKSVGKAVHSTAKQCD